MTYPRGLALTSALRLPVLVLMALQLFPIVIVVLASFKTPLALLQHGPLSPGGFYLGNYQQILGDDALLGNLGTSALVAGCSTCVSLVVGTLAAYGLSHLRFRGRRALTVGVLCARVVPPVTLAVPLFLFFQRLNLADTVPGLVIAHTTMNLPLAIWLMIPFFDSIPMELEHAALMDGCSRLQIFRLIMLPLVVPGLMVTATFCFFTSWNDFLFSLVLAGSNTKTAVLAVNSYFTGMSADWGPMAAASVVVLLPVLLLSLWLQTHVVAGARSGGVKA